MSYEKQGLFNLCKHLGLPVVFCGICFAYLFTFLLCFLLCLSVLHLVYNVTCVSGIVLFVFVLCLVPNIAFVSGLSILDCLFCFLWHFWVNTYLLFLHRNNKNSPNSHRWKWWTPIPAEGTLAFPDELDMVFTMVLRDKGSRRYSIRIVLCFFSSVIHRGWKYNFDVVGTNLELDNKIRFLNYGSISWFDMKYSVPCTDICFDIL